MPHSHNKLSDINAGRERGTLKEQEGATATSINTDGNTHTTHTHRDFYKQTNEREVSIISAGLHVSVKHGDFPRSLPLLCVKLL